ncbi:MAG: nitronate monooxygenase [Maricaulaceae bacterium]|jgi:nitronate monooxygenase
MWPSTRLCDLLGIEHPIIAAPMAGVSTPAMAAAVSNAGGLGSLGTGMASPEALAKILAEMAGLTNRAVNFNFFVHEEPDLSGYDPAPMQAALAPLYAEAGLGAPPAPKSPAPAFGQEHLEALLAHPPAIVSFHFGLPDVATIDALKAEGVRLLATATSVAEALAIEAAGIDAVIAQGAEAGGHQGSFIDVDRAESTGLFALLPQIVDAVSIPVIAAGGIADGRGVAAAFMLGADGAQIGTAFVRAEESVAAQSHKDALAAAPQGATRLTKLFSGRPARAIGNELTERLKAHEGAAAPFPAQRALIGPLAKAGLERGSIAFHNAWSGQAGPLAKAAPSATIFEVIKDEALTLLGRSGARGA